MNFNKHSTLGGFHAPFSASQSSWLRYTDERALEVYENKKAAEIGTKLHAWAKDSIDLGIKMPKSKKTLYSYVNDAIGYKMSTEVVLFYSPRFFGTADAISFRKNKLRIHDLKTGKKPADIEQLEVYAALFCLEYNKSLKDIRAELRIYQNDEIVVAEPTIDIIEPIMDKIIQFDKLINDIREEELNV